MTGIASRFVQANVRTSLAFDRICPFPPESRGRLEPHEPAAVFADASSIADVGGGKKPYAMIAQLDSTGKTYMGLDLDGDELASAPEGIYTSTRVVDICAPPSDLTGKFDFIICRSTLEHVSDTKTAIAGLALMLAPGGRCYVKLPCRKALFARLNLILPNELKRRILHAVFPHKEGDGFPAFYDKAVPSAIQTIAQSAGLGIAAEKRNFRSSYFTFFLPVYVIWRAFATLQYMTDRDYCESFEMVLCKPGNSGIQ